MLQKAEMFLQSASKNKTNKKLNSNKSTIVHQEEKEKEEEKARHCSCS